MSGDKIELFILFILFISLFSFVSHLHLNIGTQGSSQIIKNKVLYT